jgi:hypothetical protein
MAWRIKDYRNIQREKVNKAKLCIKCRLLTTNEPDKICVICKVDERVRTQIYELQTMPQSSPDLIIEDDIMPEDYQDIIPL